VNECVWSDGGMIVKGENRSIGRKTCPIATLSTTNLKWQSWQAVGKPQSSYDHGNCMNGQRNIMTDLQSGKAMFWTNSTVDSRSWDAKRSSVPRILRNPKVHYRINNSPPPVPISSQIIPAHALTHPLRPTVISCTHLPLGLPSGLLPSPPLLSSACHTPCLQAMFWTRTKAVSITATMTCLVNDVLGMMNKRDGIRGCNLLRWGMEMTASEILEEKRQSKSKGVNYNEWQATNKWKEDWS
jgi:hypothetical protein